MVEAYFVEPYTQGSGFFASRNSGVTFTQSIGTFIHAN